MIDEQPVEHFRNSGSQTIATERATGSLIPLKQDGVVFRQMFEYPVADFEVEVGFYSAVFGFRFIALTSDYALFTTPANDFHVSFRLADKGGPTAMRGLKLLFMTANVEAAETHLRGTGLVSDLHVGMGSPVQRVLHLSTPAGLPIEVWEFPDEAR